MLNIARELNSFERGLVILPKWYKIKSEKIFFLFFFRENLEDKNSARKITTKAIFNIYTDILASFHSWLYIGDDISGKY